MEKRSFNIIAINNSEHYSWGNNCDGWRFVNTDSLSVIREKMPADTQEQLHYHVKAQQFFYILSGVATFEIEGKIFKVELGQGIHVKPGTAHRISNKENQNLEFIVISEPNSHGDRINVEEK